MSSRAKVVVFCVAIASVALFTGYATFDQWSGFVGTMVRGLFGAVS